MDSEFSSSDAMADDNANPWLPARSRKEKEVKTTPPRAKKYPPRSKNESSRIPNGGKAPRGTERKKEIPKEGKEIPKEEGKRIRKRNPKKDSKPRDSQPLPKSPEVPDNVDVPEGPKTPEVPEAPKQNGSSKSWAVVALAGLPPPPQVTPQGPKEFPEKEKRKRKSKDKKIPKEISSPAAAKEEKAKENSREPESQNSPTVSNSQEVPKGKEEISKAVQKIPSETPKATEELPKTSQTAVVPDVPKVTETPAVPEVSKAAEAKGPEVPKGPEGSAEKSGNWAKKFFAGNSIPVKKTSSPSPSSSSSSFSAAPLHSHVFVPLLPTAPTLSLLEALKSSPVPVGVREVRGMTNAGNKCFLNTSLQALLSLGSFWDLLMKVGEAQDIPKEMKVLRMFVSLAREYRSVTSQLPVGSTIPVGPPLGPTMFYSLLHAFHNSKGKEHSPHMYQEDAQEFLTYLLERLHSEFLNFLRGKEWSAAPPAAVGEQEDEWQEVGKGNKTAVVVTREEADVTPISNIFGGKVRSSLKRFSSKPSVSITSFNCLHLDIQGVSSVEEALKRFGEEEVVEGVRDARTKEEVKASKRLTLEKLPKVLILHLKRFSFEEKAQKVTHHVTFGVNLSVDPSLLAVSLHQAPKKYKLASVITHHGETPLQGHYTCDVRQGNGIWQRYDDATVYKVSKDEVLSSPAYILFYELAGNSHGNANPL